jgi:predicted amidophosphoribosyltransferase
MKADPYPEPAGFPKCPECAFAYADNWSICHTCASSGMAALAPDDRRCRICDHPLIEDQCRNPPCNMAQRFFGWNSAVTVKSGPIDKVLKAYKYANEPSAWMYIFGRILLGHLNSKPELFSSFNVIIPSPTFIRQPPERTWDHTAAVIKSAAEMPSPWPFYTDSPQVVRKVTSTPSMTGMNYKQRRENAEGPIREALEVARPEITEGKNILVYDDVFTDGLTLREIARALRQSGASIVCGVTLVRAIYKGR